VGSNTKKRKPTKTSGSRRGKNINQLSQVGALYYRPRPENTLGTNEFATCTFNAEYGHFEKNFELYASDRTSPTSGARRMIPYMPGVHHRRHQRLHSEETIGTGSSGLANRDLAGNPGKAVFLASWELLWFLL